MSECDDDRFQVLRGRVGDHNRHNFREDLEGGIDAIFFMCSYELLKGRINRLLKVLVSQQ